MRTELDSDGGLGSDFVNRSDDETPRVPIRGSDLLQRIAEAIGVTVDMFRDDPPVRAGRSPATTAEVHALLDAFLALQGPAARRRCISLASAELARGH